MRACSRYMTASCRVQGTGKSFEGTYVSLSSKAADDLQREESEGGELEVDHFAGQQGGIAMGLGGKGEEREEREQAKERGLMKFIVTIY